MKLMILASEFPPGPGGLGTHAYHVALQMIHSGWDVEVLAAQDYVSDTEASEYNARAPFRIIRLPSLRGTLRDAFARAGILRRSLSANRPDVLVATGQRSVWLGALFARWYDFPLVAVAHGSEFGSRPRWSSRATIRAFDSADAVISVSNFTQEVMLGAGVKPRRLAIIPNGADLDVFREFDSPTVSALRRSLLPDARHLLLTVGQLSERKGQATVIRAMPAILRDAPETHYVMVGQPTEREKLEALARDLGVSSYVHFVGRVYPQDLVAWDNVCDIFLMTSRTMADGDCEGYGIAVAEAALCGKPAIVSANTGLAEAIVDGITGMCVPENDASAVAKEVLLLLGDHERRISMGKAARMRAETQQTWNQRGTLYDQILRETAEGHLRHRVTVQ